jgi:aarF domain-containing kinase
LFLAFDEQPVASGSIAQVHRAVLAPAFVAAHVEGGGKPPPAVVAVKVRHPSVDTIIARDFAILRLLAEAAAWVPGLRWMRLDESVRQFREPLFEQVDLSREAHNLRVFNKNFAAWRRVSFPVPVDPLIAPSVLVESFEEGQSIAAFMQGGDPQLRRSVADLGVKTLLKMMLADNWVHADLHPGNILVRLDPPAKQNALRRWLRPKAVPHIVLLDCGMTTSLSDRNKHNLVHFFEAITRGDGRGVAEMALAFSDRQTCPQPQAFVDDLVGLFSTAVAWGFDVNTSEWMAAVLESVRRHQVHLASEVCSVVVTALVLEGWSNRLDPDICIMQQIRQVVFGSERLQARLEDLAKLLS